MGSLPLTFGGLGRRRHGDGVQGAAITVRPSSLSNWARCTPNTAGRGMRQARTPSPPPSFLSLSLPLSRERSQALSLSRASRPLPSLNVAPWIVLVAVRSERGRESDDGVRLCKGGPDTAAVSLSLASGGPRLRPATNL